MKYSLNNELNEPFIDSFWPTSQWNPCASLLCKILRKYMGDFAEDKLERDVVLSWKINKNEIMCNSWFGMLNFKVWAQE